MRKSRRARLIDVERIQAQLRYSARQAYEAARTGFEQGLHQVFLTAGDERAGRVYERVGFRPAGFALAYIEPGGN